MQVVLLIKEFMSFIYGLIELVIVIFPVNDSGKLISKTLFFFWSLKKMGNIFLLFFNNSSK